MELSLLTLLTCAAGGVPEATFLDDYDLVWEIAPRRWLEGIPLANGDIGALVWGDGAPLKITLDKYDAWETREKSLHDVTYAQLREWIEVGDRKRAEECMRTQRIYPEGPYPTRLPMPRLELDFGNAIEWDYGRLWLRTATADISGSVGGDPVLMSLLVHTDKNVLLIRIDGKAAGDVGVRVSLDHLNDKAKSQLAAWGYPEPTVESTDTAGSFHVAAPSGYEYAIAWQRKDTGTGQLLCLSLLSNEDAEKPLPAAKALAAEALAAPDITAHEAWWAEYWQRSYLALPNARFEALYWAEMYKLGCLSRPGKWPITLQGLWTLDGGMPPWSGDYHLDMNVQQTYWPIYAANRLELGEPLYDRFSACIPRWREQCRAFFGFDGIWSGCAIGPRGERVFGYSGVELWPGNAAWLAQHYWLHFLYSQDKEFLQAQALPMLRLSFMTYSGLLEEGDDGKLHVPLSYSPEYYEGSFEAYCKDPSCDLALIRFLCDAILESNDVLGKVDELTERVKEVQQKLADYPQKDNRLFVSADTPLAHSHRHHSHLMAIHPLGLITPNSAEAPLIRASLHEIRVKGTGEWTGWAYPWMSLIASRARYGNMAWQMLDTYANSFIMPNTFHINGDPRTFGISLFDYEPMTLEAGFGAAAALMEMLLQSHSGQIRVFPSMPDRWHDAYFADLRAEGAFLVTAKLAAGEVPFVIVASEAGLPCSVVNPFGGAPACVAEFDPATGQCLGEAKAISGDVVQFDTEPGGCYIVFPEGKTPTAEALAPTRFDRPEDDKHFYGVKKLARF